MYKEAQTEFIRDNYLIGDRELTERFNSTFGTNVSKASIRKKRQRMGLNKSAMTVRAEWTSIMGLSRKEIMDLLKDTPPVDIYWEQQRLSEAKRGLGPVDI